MQAARTAQVVHCVGQEGFGLVETLMAILTIAIGMMFVCQMMFVSLAGATLARSKGAAIVAAQNQLEYLADLYRQNPTGSAFALGNHGPVQIEITNPSDSRKLNRFRVAWTVATVSDPRAGRILKAVQVTVTVTPIGAGTSSNTKVGQNKVVSVTTVFSPTST